MIVVVGEVTLDVVAFHDAPLAVASDTPARISLRPGGAGANTAAWLARAGVEVALIAQVGDDDAAAAALAGLDGVDLRVGVDAHLPTGTCIVLVSPGGERTMLPDPGANIALEAGGLSGDLFVAGNVLHVSGYSLMRPGSRTAALLAMDKARDAGMPVSVDPASAALLARRPRLPRPRAARRPAAAQRGRVRGARRRSAGREGVRDQARRATGRAGATGAGRSPRRPCRSTTCSTPPAPATPSPPAS